MWNHHEYLRRCGIGRHAHGARKDRANGTPRVANGTDLYAEGLKRDTVWRREWSDKAGLGFSWSGLYRAKKDAAVVLKKAA